MKGQLSRNKRGSIWRKSDGHCWYCGIELDPFGFVADHFDPKANGGSNSFENLVPSCDSCNRAKSSQSIEEFREYRTMPKFSDRQIGFLESRGITMKGIRPEKDHVFAYELYEWGTG